MQKAVEHIWNGQTLRGMEHIPANAYESPVPAVILFHGFTGTKLEPHRFFLKISRALEQLGFASFRFDFIGSGESDGDFTDMTVSSEMEQAHALLDRVLRDPRIDNSRVSLLGFSMGGLIASVVAGERNADIHSLILLAAAGTMAEKYAKNLATNLYIDGKGYDLGGNLVSKEFLDDLQTIPVFEKAKEFKGNVMLIHGTNDTSVPYDVSNQYNRLSYNDRGMVHFIDGANHTFDSFVWEQQVIAHICNFVNNT
ncbi:alpha/beta fold hydrolase [Bacillus sp. HMF5848]|uniref:alpha/beta hydrolase n=1 Tax=Bacillus sp. HMF5848 TaxID=2495421 RepID=UPI000F795742|nr:alpha/beta fold hydrolase [Bacillus sp. HMF5848]RSK26006.1 alpha/beta fold hydrolase [Bacillus sp. HMF5848]